MDVNLLYFTMYGNDPSELTSWGAILIDDGEMESFVGAEQTELQAIVDGMTKCLERFPTTLPIVIRSRHRTVQQLGKRWIQNWHEHGWENEECPELITGFLNTIETRRLEWFNPPYSDPLDKNVLEYAIDEWEYHNTIKTEPVVVEKPVHTNSVDTPVDEPTTQNDRPIEPLIEPLIEPQFNAPQSKDTTSGHIPNSIPASNVSHDIISEVETSTPLPVVTIPNTKPVGAISSNDRTAISTSSISIDPLDKERYPHIDDDGWVQLYTLFETPSYSFVPDPKEINEIPVPVPVPVRILAYVDARQNLDLAAWSFALIDNLSRTALFKSSGQRQSTLQRSLLQGCIAVLSSLRKSSHTIEFRTSRLDLIRLIGLLIENPYADCPEEWETESAFVSQLSFYLEQQPVLVKILPHHTTDFASQIIQNLGSQRLDALNNGGDSEFSMRKKFFPIERLTN
jgi:hypothetical protein